MYKPRGRRIPHAQYKKMIHHPTKHRKAHFIVNAPGVKLLQKKCPTFLKGGEVQVNFFILLKCLY
jgi:hypothetical protein